MSRPRDPHVRSGPIGSVITCPKCYRQFSVFRSEERDTKARNAALRSMLRAHMKERHADLTASPETP